MNIKVNIEKIINKALRGGGEFCDIFFEKRNNSSIICEDNKIQSVIIGTDQGVGIRVIKNGRTAYAYTNSFEEKEILRLAESLSTSSIQTINCCNIGEPVLYSQGSYKTVEISSKLAWIKEGNNIIRSYGDRIVQAKIAYSDMTQDVLIANSEGLYLQDQRRASHYLAQVVAKSGNVIQTGYDVRGGNADFDASDDLRERVCRTAAGRAILMLDAQPAAGGKFPVVLSSDAGGTMVHEAIGHGLEADLADEGLSVYTDRIGESVASSLVTIVDDSTVAEKRGTYNFDDEGTKAEKTVLVECGILKSYMYDRLSAMKAGKVSTGNGRRENFRYRPIVRMTNTIILPGESVSQDIVKSVKNGLFVVSMGGGEVNTVNGDFVFEVTEGYKIENGEITTPLRGATLCGNGPDVLSNIEAVGSDLGFGIGVCGKDGQGVGVSDAQPTLLLKEITVGGVV